MLQSLRCFIVEDAFYWRRYQNVVLARYAGRHATHQDLASLGPGKHVWSSVSISLLLSM